MSILVTWPESTYRCRVHGISKELEACTFTTQDTSRHRTRVDAHTKAKFFGIRTELDDHLPDHFTELGQDVLGKPSHGHSVIFEWFREASHSHVTIANSLNLEDSSALSDLVE